MTSIDSEETLRIPILGSESIIVGHDMTDLIAKECFSLLPKTKTWVIVTDANLKGWLDNLMVAFKDVNPLNFIISPGEESKCRSVKAEIEDWMLSHKCTRDTAMIALGGGVVGDLTGFIAATFMRGIPFFQIPTSLLAMVDSSIGGKTAIDTRAGKNLIGAFHQPLRVFIDIKYLKTLPKREFVNGMAEVIKTAAIRSAEDFELLENYSEKILAASCADLNSEDSYLIKKIIIGSASVKADIVSCDEKEGGLRGLLNFGHSIGHAIEAILSPEMLHGECISIGAVYESEIARNMGYLNDMSVGRLLRVFQAYGLPVSLYDKRVQNIPKKCTVDSLLDFMCVDKKNVGSEKRIVMLSGIGKTAEQRASYISDSVIRKVLSPSIAVIPPRPSFSASQKCMRVPGSKSMSNRALILAAMGEGECRLHGLLHSDDVQVMLDALQKIVGISYTWESDGTVLVVTGGGGRLRVPEQEIYLGNAGTASRFLTTICSLISSHNEHGKATILTGNARMKQRPIGPLVKALNRNGCDIKYLGENESLPIEINPTGKGLNGGLINLSASISSQYVSSILMAAPYASEEVTLSLEGDSVISQPYIDMTLSMMRSFGIIVTKETGADRYVIPKGVYKNPVDYFIEADASSATYPLAFAAITGTRVTITNMGSNSLQGDSKFACKVLEKMGCIVEQTETTTTVTGPSELEAIQHIDMTTMTDAFLTATILAAVASKGPSFVTTITGIANQRVKECNRIAAMVEQLSKFGVQANELEDGIQIHAIPRSKLCNPFGGVKCYDDHRIAMSFSILACVLPVELGFTTINEKKCVEKTWPGWWDTLENILGVSLSGVDAGNEIIFNHLAHHAKEVSNESSIVLIGMRGAGKTTLGKIAARVLKLKFIDMDDYLEKSLGKKITEIIETEGWEAFRKYETESFKKVLSENPTKSVISSGGKFTKKYNTAGGIVESVESRDILKEWIENSGLIFHIKRNINEVTQYLNSDPTRPSLPDDVHKVWNRREKFYKECSNYEFVVPSRLFNSSIQDDNLYWKSVETVWEKMLRFIKSERRPIIPFENSSFFVSLTYSNYQSLENLSDISVGADAVEFRVDLLESYDPVFVSEQLAFLRSSTSLPIIFTVRSMDQGGIFPKDRLSEMMDLIEHAMRWCCEYVDLEITTLIPQYMDRLESVRLKKGNSALIASFHDTKNQYSWDNEERLCKMQTMYLHLYHWGDIIKLIGVADSIKSNFGISGFMDRISDFGLPPKPLIALNMGRLGQISRVLNTFMTPVTHPLLKAAAPGQLCIKDIHSLRYQIGMLKPCRFFLFGSPISHSLSPKLHNSGFECLGLPHRFELFESLEIEKVQNHIKNGISDGTFGGAAITIPHKELLFSFVSSVTSSASKIGAINTICLGIDGSLVGDNTDWIGIKRSLSETGCSASVAILLGAGGTARAACYALNEIESIKEIRLWNRTFSRAQKLSREFPKLVICDWNDLVPENTKVFIVSTLPPTAQELCDWSKLNASGSSGVVLDLVYYPRVTPLISFFSKNSKYQIVYGIKVLLYQGLEQFKLWTGRNAPAADMSASIGA